MGQCHLLEKMFHFLERSCDSLVVGDVLVQWLLRIGVDVEACVRNELIQLPGGNLIWDRWDEGKQVVFERRGEGS
jgi:hypothetical protein